MPDDDVESHLYGDGLLGEAMAPKRTGNLAERFMVPPFTILSARDGWWQNRKRSWIALGIKSELGRGGDLTMQGDIAHDLDHYRHKEGTRRDHAAPGGSLMPAMNYKNRERGNSTGAAIEGTAAAAQPVTFVSKPITFSPPADAPQAREAPAVVPLARPAVTAPVVAGARAMRLAAEPVRADVAMPNSLWRPPTELPSLSGRKIISIAYDTETTGLNPKTDRMIGLSVAIDSDGPRLYLPFGHEGGDNLPEENVKQWILDEIVPLQTEMIGAYLLFDLEMSAMWGVRFPNITAFHDVQVAEPLIDEWLDKYSLDSLSIRYLGKGKSETLLRAAAARYGWTSNDDVKRNLHKLPARYVGAYAEADADLPMDVWGKQKKILEDQELMKIYEVERKLIPILLAMRLRGVPIDVPRGELLLEKLTKERDSRLIDLKRLAGSKAEFKATASLAPALRDRGIPVPRTKATERFSEGQDSVTEALLVEYKGDAMVNALLVGRRVDTMATYVEKSILENIIDGRIYPTFNQLRREREDGGGRQGTIARFCLSGGTQIMTPNGTKNIEDITEGDLVYCYDEEQCLRLRSVKWSGKTGLRQIYKVVFKRGLTWNAGFEKSLFMTGDHLVRLADGSYLAAQNLLYGTRVMSLHRTSNGPGTSDHLHIFGKPQGRGLSEHRAIYTITYGDIPPGRQHHVHHKDDHHFHHNPENLELLSASEHTKSHQTPEEARRRALLAHKRYGHKITSAAASAMDTWSRIKNPPERILALFDNGWTVNGIAKKLTIRQSTVVKRLLEQNVSIERIPSRWRPNNHVVYSVEQIPGLHEVYDIEVDGCHNFIANEICVHNSCTDPNLQAVGKREKLADDLIDMDEEISSSIRRLFPAEPGERIQRKDMSQAEFRLTVNIAVGRGAEEARERYRKEPNLSFHRMCGELANIDPNDKKQYDRIKALNLGKSYGAQGPRIAKLLGCSIDEANAFIRRYEAALPFTVDTFKAAKKAADERGFIRTILGRRQRFPLWEPANNRRGEGWRPALSHDRALASYGANIVRAHTYKALNRYDQASCADIFKKSLVDIHEAGIFDVIGAPLLLVHDELVDSIPDTQEGREAAEEMPRIMGTCVPMNIPLLIDVSYGPTWGDCA